MVFPLLIGAGALIGLGYLSIKIVRPTERGLVERFGKYNRFGEPGLTLIIPLVERMVEINVTEIMVDAKPQEIITQDKLNADVDAQVYFKIKSDEMSVKASQYNVFDVEHQIVNLARTTLRNIIGTMTLADVNSKRDIINRELAKTLAIETKNWGVEVIRTELKEVTPPEDVQETMNKVVIAENEKIAAKDFANAVETKADGARRAAIKEAQGIAESTREKAKGAADAIKLTASAQAEAIQKVNTAANKYFQKNAQVLKKLEVTEASLKDNSKVIFTEKGISPMIILGEGHGILPIDKKIR